MVADSKSESVAYAPSLRMGLRLDLQVSPYVYSEAEMPPQINLSGTTPMMCIFEFVFIVHGSVHLPGDRGI